MHVIVTMDLMDYIGLWILAIFIVLCIIGWIVYLIKYKLFKWMNLKKEKSKKKKED